MYEIQQAERRGYARGYAAAKRAASVKRLREQQKIKQNALWQRCFVAAIPACMDGHGWVTGGKVPIVSLDDRIDLARKAADEALRVATRHGRC